MIVKQMKNASFRTTSEYVLEKEEACLLDTNMLGDTPRQMSREIAALRRMRPHLKRAILHATFSLPYKKENDSIQSKETLSDERFVEFVNSWREVMEVTNTLYFIARHSDTDHDHVHLVASRIRRDGSVVDDSWDYRRSEVAVRQLEKEFGLEPVRCSSFSVAEKLASEGIEVEVSRRRALTRKQLPHSSGEPSIAERVADIIDEAIQDRPTVTQLIGRLQQQGVKVHPTFSTRGLFREAIAFERDGVAIAGNKLGKAYSFPGLLKYRGVSYDPERDMPALVAAAAGKMVQLEEIQQPSTSNQFQIPAGIQKSNPTPQSTSSNHFLFPAGIQKSNPTPQPTQAKASHPQRPDLTHYQLVGNLMSLVDRELKRTKTNQSSGQTWDVWKEDEHHLAMRRHSDGLELQAIYNKDARWQPVDLPPLSTTDVQALQEFTQKLEQWLREREIEQKKEQKRQKKKQRQLEL